MHIIGNYVSGIGCESTIHKLIVIGVCGDEIPVEIGVDKLNILTLQNQFHHMLGD